VAEIEKEQTQLEQHALDPRLYYDYEGRFIKQRLERDHMRMLPRVVRPAMFASGGHALGDMRVFERYTAGPATFLTCRFFEVAAGASAPLQRRIPSVHAFILEGDGMCVQEDVEHPFRAGDLVMVPPYTRYRFVGGQDGFRAWSPEIRLWHVLGLLFQEEFEPQELPASIEVRRDEQGAWQGYRVPKGVLGLQHDLDVRAGEDPRRSAVFAARRAAADRGVAAGDTKWDYFLRLQAEDAKRADADPRVIRGADVPWESTRHGKLQYYLSNWTNTVGQAVDLAVHEIEPGGHSGRHRHIAEELLLILDGTGHDVQDGVEHPWQAGDLVVIPPMTEHQHFASPGGTARFITTWIHHPANEFLGGVEHIADASSGAAR
jgi:mannose-6-phosphate isomerase-like protein (cupin superfamily)